MAKRRMKAAAKKNKAEAERKTPATKKKTPAAKKKTVKRHTRAGPPPNIGFLVSTTINVWQTYTKAFEKQLKTAYGWTKGTDYNVEYQPAGGQQSLYTAIATDFANPERTNPINVIVTGGTAPTRECIRATTTIPIVFATAGEGAYLVGSSTGPVTGISNEQAARAIVLDRLQFMQNFYAPKLGANFLIGLIGNTSVRNVQDEMAMAIAVGAPGRVFQSTAPLTTVDDIPAVMQDLIDTHGVQTLYVCTDPLITSNADLFNQWAALKNLQTMHTFKGNRGNGNTTGPFKGPKLEILFGQAADFVYSILTPPYTVPHWVPADPSKFDHYP
jgi:putative tryptophan/tyrosine transport system substrate-binding protein